MSLAGGPNSIFKPDEVLLFERSIMNPLRQGLFITLTELYTLQIQLENIPASSLKIPDDAIFNRDAAL